MPSIKELAIKDNLDKLINFVINGIKNIISDDITLNRIKVVCEEIIINVINYAYPNETGEMVVSYEIINNNEEKKLFIEVQDTGIPFNPLKKEKPDLTSPIEERPVGGLGIYLTKQIMDEINYRRENEKNILSMKKNI